MNKARNAAVHQEGAFKNDHQQLHSALSLIEAVRATAAELDRLVSTVESHISDQHVHAEGARDLTEQQRLTDAHPFRWLDDARHNLQAGVMFLERAVTQPTSF